ncbi:hypothetical protein [Amycolatopsis sp. H20-H5]|uniref:hypothetical protein n=1 Tax=Amycolatopsis sp. H20-H5 TaxID=3046309 RepID=UPI002DB6F1CA|nr:hypothetical protein [Amycolatopsis sp. H20-H5]MEC3975079.1 hypothetical protein [Amycolatopsis sp. H20-H5]
MNLWAIVTGAIVAITGLLGSVVLVFKARPEVRKLKTDGTAALLSATTATGAELADEVRSLRADVTRLWQAQHATQERITVHLRWDAKVVDAVRELGGDIADPPPLYPEGT